MFQPIPGYCHLKTLQCEVPSSKGTLSSSPVTKDMFGIVQVALDATFGMRPHHQLPRMRFDARVRTHIAAQLRASPLRGPVQLLRLDAQPAFVHRGDPETDLGIRAVAAAEVLGSCEVRPASGAPTRKAFACRLEQTAGKRHWVMKSFRVF